jgi:hypothetical protein
MDSQQSEQTPETSRPTVYDWVDGLVLLSYAGGPEFADLSDNAYSLVRGPVESKLGIFLLKEVNTLGVLVRKVKRGEGEKLRYDSAIFIPWAAVQLIRDLLMPDNTGE